MIPLDSQILRKLQQAATTREILYSEWSSSVLSLLYQIEPRQQPIWFPPGRSVESWAVRLNLPTLLRAGLFARTSNGTEEISQIAVRMSASLGAIAASLSRERGVS